MLQETISLLDKYEQDIKKLDLSNKNIKGILNLEKFYCLEELDCSLA